MIAELFYPKELKEIIRDLEAKNNLRREPLKKLNKELNYMFSQICLLLLCTLFSGTIIEMLFYILFYVILSYILVKDRMHKLKSYIYGKKENGTIIQIKHAYFRNTIIRVSRLSDGNNIRLNRLDLLIKDFHGVQVGKDISFYETAEKFILPMPDITIVKEYYCLRKDLMD